MQGGYINRFQRTQKRATDGQEMINPAAYDTPEDSLKTEILDNIRSEYCWEGTLIAHCHTEWGS